MKTFDNFSKGFDKLLNRFNKDVESDLKKMDFAMGTIHVKDRSIQVTIKKDKCEITINGTYSSIIINGKEQIRKI